MTDALSAAAAPLDIGDLSEIPESQPLNDGSYAFKIRSAKVIQQQMKDGTEKEKLQLVLLAEGQPDADPIIDGIFLPSPQDSPEDVLGAKRRLKRVFYAAGVASNVPADLVNKVVHLEVRGKMYEGERIANVRWPKAHQ